jgi:hypothetical protein
MYTQDYSVTIAPRKPYPTPGLRVIGWSNARGLTRGERGKLQYGITHANVTAMTAAMVIVQAEHNDLQVRSSCNSNSFILTANDMSRSIQPSTNSSCQLGASPPLSAHSSTHSSLSPNPHKERHGTSKTTKQATSVTQSFSS